MTPTPQHPRESLSEELREGHWRSDIAITPSGAPVCIRCKERFPCSAIRAADRIEQLERALREIGETVGNGAADIIVANTLLGRIRAIATEALGEKEGP